MSYGLQVFNPSGGLVLSNDGFGLNYIGKAPFLDNVTPPAPESYGGGSGTFTTYKRYRITSSTPIAVCMPLDSGVIRGIVSISRSGSTWDIVAFNESGGTDANGFRGQQPMDVFCFARPSGSPQTNYGLAIYDSAGVLAWDLTRGAPLFFRAILSFADGQTSATLPSGFTRPAVLGLPTGYADPAPRLINAGLGRYSMDGSYQGLQISGTTITRPSSRFRNGPTEDYGAESPQSSVLSSPAMKLYVIESSGLT